MMRVIGIGPIGILILNSIAFNSCSVWLIDVLVSEVFFGNAYCPFFILYSEFNIFDIKFSGDNQATFIEYSF